MPPEVRSLFPTPSLKGGEVISALLSGAQFRLEHIVSFGAASTPGFWYDQEWAEWVALARGSAILEFEDGLLELAAGDCLLITAHLKHRIAHTSADAVWIALHFRDRREPGGPQLSGTKD